MYLAYRYTSSSLAQPESAHAKRLARHVFGAFSLSSFVLGIPGLLGSSFETLRSDSLTDCLVTYIICQSQHPYSMRFS